MVFREILSLGKNTITSFTVNYSGTIENINLVNNSAIKTIKPDIEYLFTAKDSKNNPKSISRQGTRKGTQILSGKNLIPINNTNSNLNKPKLPNKVSSSKIQLDGSIKTCEDLQIPSSDICRSTKDVDAIINMSKK